MFDFKKILNNKLLQNVVIVGTGTACAQLIAILFSPLLTRIYGPEILGIYGIFIAFVAVVSPLITLSYPFAIVLEENDEDAKHVLLMCVYISLANSFLLWFAFFVGGEGIFKLFNVEHLAPFVHILFLNVFFLSLIQIYQQWCIRKGLFRITAKATIIQSFIANSLKTLLGYFYPLTFAIIGATTIGSALHFALLRTWIREQRNLFKVKGKRNCTYISLARRYRDFPYYRTPQVLINTISQSLPIILLSAFWGPASAGFYTICRGVLSLPTKIIGKSMGDVYYPYAAALIGRGDNIKSSLIKSTLVMVLIGSLPFAVIIAAGPHLFAFVFGQKWSVAGEYAQWLSVMIFFNFINRPSVVVVPILGLQRGLMVYEIVSTIAKILSLYLGMVYVKDDVLAIAFFSIVGAFSYFLLISWVIFSAKSYRGDIRQAI